jgi:integrase
LFTDYLINVKGLHNQHLSRVIKFVKSFQNYTFENGFHNNIDFKKFKLFKDNADEIISLEIDEIKAIEELQNNNNYIMNAKDLFLFLCYTGVRFSDLAQIDGNQIKDGFISVLTQKTKQNVLIPVHPRLAVLAKKYTVNGVIKLHLISNVKLNVYLKEIGQLVGLNEDIKKVRFIGSGKTEIVKKKWELLTTHTGKRTFVTIAILSGISIEVIKRITGNKDDATFTKYQRFSNEQLKKEMQSWNK